MFKAGAIASATAEGEQLIITLEELLVEKQAKSGFASASGNGVTVALNTDITAELEQEGWVREVIRAVQDTRKKLDLPIEKRIDLVLHVDEELKAALEAFSDVLQDNVLVQTVSYEEIAGIEYVTVRRQTNWDFH